MIKFLFATPEDIFEPTEYEQESSIFIGKISKSDSTFCIISNYPAFVFTHLGQSPALIHHLLKEQNNKILAHAMILSLVRKSATKTLLPENVISTLIQTMNDTSDILRLQITSAIIAQYIQDDPYSIPELLKSFHQQKPEAKAFLFAALFLQAPMSETFLSQSLIELNDLVLKPNYSSFALHSLSLLLASRPIEIMAMKSSIAQCQVLFSILNSSAGLNVSILYHLSSYFISLLPCISPELPEAKEEFIVIVRLIIQSFRQHQLPYSQLITFRTLRNVFAFARHLVGIPRISFPIERESSMSLCLMACGAFTDYLKGAEFDPEFFDLVPRVTLLLQRSCDSRASEFIIQLAITFTETTPIRSFILKWVEFIKSILTSNVLPFMPSAPVEANKIVKICASEVSLIILPALAKSLPLMTECLDDIVTSATRAIETKYVPIIRPAFQLNSLILSTFEHEKTEQGNRLLELYDSQFSIAVRVGFQIDLSLSSSFLISFMDFHLENLQTQPEDFQTVLNSYINGLMECKQKVPSFFWISCSLCSIAKLNPDVFETIKPFLGELLPELAPILSNYIQMRKVEDKNREKLHQFRMNFSQFFSPCTLR